MTAHAGATSVVVVVGGWIVTVVVVVVVVRECEVGCDRCAEDDPQAASSMLAPSASETVHPRTLGRSKKEVTVWEIHDTELA
jgi:hypothetical protein